jgi:hypothetical protein
MKVSVNSTDLQGVAFHHVQLDFMGFFMKVETWRQEMGLGEQQKLLAVYSYVDDVKRALNRLKGQGALIETVYSPAPHGPFDKILMTKPSPVRRFVLFGAMFGASFGIFIAVYTALRWNLVVWGKPPVNIVPYVVLAFEFAVLFAVISGIIGFLILSRMPRFTIPAHFDPRFTVDKYGLLLTCPVDLRDKIDGLLRESGAEEVRDADI